jgi:hypothetical protein
MQEFPSGRSFALDNNSRFISWPRFVALADQDGQYVRIVQIEIVVGLVKVYRIFLQTNKPWVSWLFTMIQYAYCFATAHKKAKIERCGSSLRKFPRLTEECIGGGLEKFCV